MTRTLKPADDQGTLRGIVFFDTPWRPRHYNSQGTRSPTVGAAVPSNVARRQTGIPLSPATDRMAAFRRNFQDGVPLTPRLPLLVVSPSPVCPTVAEWVLQEISPPFTPRLPSRLISIMGAWTTGAASSMPQSPMPTFALASARSAELGWTRAPLPRQHGRTNVGSRCWMSMPTRRYSGKHSRMRGAFRAALSPFATHTAPKERTR